MTAAELTAQIRAAKPIASDGLRERVRAIAGAEAAPALRARLRVPRLRIVLPIAAATAIAAAAAIALVRPQAQHQVTLSPDVQRGRSVTTARAQGLAPVTTAPSRIEGTPSTDTHAAGAPSAPAFGAAGA